MEMESVHEESEGNSKWRGSLMVFTKTRLFLLFLTSMLLGISFFLLGYFLGYEVGKEKAVGMVTQALLHPNEASPELRDTMLLLEKQKKEKAQELGLSTNARPSGLATYIVHIGLFTDQQYASQAWQKVQHASRLSPQEAIVQIIKDDNIFYKVILGKFKRKDEARVYARSVATDAYNNITPAIEETFDQ